MSWPLPLPFQAAPPSRSRRRATPRWPRAPVFSWQCLGTRGHADVRGIESLPHRASTTSGRAALYQTLALLHLPPGTPVLLPSYYCPTMVAPIVLTGLQPRFYALRADGTPDLDRVDVSAELPARAMIVAHLFGIPRSLATERAFCDAHGIALIEDCAHCCIGDAGGRPVGAWGDFSIASLTKFFPVPEAGLVASATRSIPPLSLQRRSVTDQLKGVVDVLQRAAESGRPRGLATAVAALLRLRRVLRRPLAAVVPINRSAQSGVADCDMGRVSHAPLLVAAFLLRVVSRPRLAQARRANFEQLRESLSPLPGCRPMLAAPPAAGSAPYVFPLWVDDADRVYNALRAAGCPVLRWDTLWRGAPVLADDHGPRWSEHVLQFLCHQDLDRRDIDEIVELTRRALRADMAACT